MSNLRFSKKIALRYLWSRRSEAFITIITVVAVLGVAIGVMVINIVMAIMTGFEHELRSKVVGNAHIIVQKLGGPMHAWQSARDKVTALPGVASVSAFTQHQVLLTIGNRSRGVLVQGLDQSSAAAKELSGYLEHGASLDLLLHPPPVEVPGVGGESELAKLPAIIVGHELTELMQLKVGDTVSLLSPQVGSTPFGLLPHFRRFLVAASYKSGLVGYEEALVYVHLEDAQQFFRLGDAVTGLEVMVRSIDEAPKIAQEIYSSLSESGAFYVQDWTERNKELWEAIKLEKTVYFIVLLLLIVLASFSIVTTLVMIVLEKRRDIAILKTMGASTASIANIFRIQGAVIGGIGTVLGLIAGYLGSVALREYGFQLPAKVFPTDTVPVQLDPINFIAVGAAAFLICFFSTVYPARRASRLEPAEVLRYE